ncbi:hypothetical protein BGZ70_000936 [Mortierella alpina]|uniref:G-patch domain-containing protein n=1 Tax=Mortierella alpina TaxID=64518 RepID=A0A9P6IX96_MORAP|nr:hypothetical protein BGZ70_000936 [Mortierella alpina]
MDHSIGDNGAQALSEVLKTNSTLTVLNLTGNSIGVNGAQELSEALRTNMTLTVSSIKKRGAALTMSNAQDEEEDDYMSQAFLDSLVNEGKKAKQSDKASLTYSERRRQKEREHLANLPKPLHVREKEAREKGLEKEIGEENKGMAMLLKMGFKKGGSLGASKADTEAGSSSGTGTTSTSSHGPDVSKINRPDALRAPIAIQMKQGRGGLGMESAKRRREDEELQKLEHEVHRLFDEGFRGQKITQFEQEKWKRQLTAARGLCMRMDAQKAAASTLLVDEEQKQIEDEDTASQRSRRIGRSNSFWWISDSVPDEILGTRLMGPGADVAQVPDLGGRVFDHSDEEDGDLESNKQKPSKRTKVDPALVAEVEDETAAEPEVFKWGERPEFAQLEESEKLEKVVQYLRAEHAYCFWCSAQYDGREDLEENCPGEMEDDH